MTLRVLINAGPWLPVPPGGYGGIENVVATLIPALRELGVYVVLATVGTSRIEVDEQLSVFEEPQFRKLQLPYNRVMGVASAHQQRVAGELRRRTDLDLVHDHVEALGPTVLAALGADAPPVLHTLHWDLAKHPELYGGFDGRGRLFVNGVSESQLARAPHALRAHSLGHVHLATPLAAGHRPLADKADHLAVLGRITEGKGQHVAARLAHENDLRVVLAGPVGPHHTPGELDRALRTDRMTAQNPDVRYWLDEVADHVDGDRVRWLGAVGPAARDELLGTARATVFPLCWEEPGGTAVVESLALGTPVVGYRRGCLPELVEHGRTGLLVDPGDEDALAAQLHAVGSIDPAECRREAERRFAPSVMAEHYLRLYRTVLANAGMRTWRPVAAS
jgi:glycosyltransferase involved in cell wall biosynthesis